WMTVLVWPLIGLMVMAVGWIEDFAAKRSPRLWPDGSKPSTPRPSAGKPPKGRRAASKGGSHRG
ncbi:hypothetical protein ACQKIP_21935, partial [Streptomyces sp. NPDC059900]